VRCTLVRFNTSLRYFTLGPCVPLSIHRRYPTAVNLPRSHAGLRRTFQGIVFIARRSTRARTRGDSSALREARRPSFRGRGGGGGGGGFAFICRRGLENLFTSIIIDSFRYSRFPNRRRCNKVSPFVRPSVRRRFEIAAAAEHFCATMQMRRRWITKRARADLQTMALCHGSCRGVVTIFVVRAVRALPPA